MTETLSGVAPETGCNFFLQSFQDHFQRLEDPPMAQGRASLSVGPLLVDNKATPLDIPVDPLESVISTYGLGGREGRRLDKRFLRQPRQFKHPLDESLWGQVDQCQITLDNRSIV
jgi:hypothetical protein